MADFSAGLQTWQEERYVILLSYFFWGEDLHDNCASHPPSNCDKKGGGGGVRLFRTGRLIG